MKNGFLIFFILILIVNIAKWIKKKDFPENSDTALQKRIISECAGLGDAISKEVDDCEKRIKSESH